MSRYLLYVFLLAAVSGGHVDALPLMHAGRTVDPPVPADLMWAIAYVETHHNLSPAIVAHGCVHSNCARGRMQIKPRTAEGYCPKKNINTYWGNVTCAAKILRAHYEETGSWDLAAAWYHSRTPSVHEPYLERVKNRRSRYTWEVE